MKAGPRPARTRVNYTVHGIDDSFDADQQNEWRQETLKRGGTGLGDGMILIAGTPLTPIAPTTLPSRFSGMPPAKIMILPLFDA